MFELDWQRQEMANCHQKRLGERKEGSPLVYMSYFKLNLTEEFLSKEAKN